MWRRSQDYLPAVVLRKVHDDDFGGRHFDDRSDGPPVHASPARGRFAADADLVADLRVRDSLHFAAPYRWKTPPHRLYPSCVWSLASTRKTQQAPSQYVGRQTSLPSETNGVYQKGLSHSTGWVPHGHLNPGTFNLKKMDPYIFIGVGQRLNRARTEFNEGHNPV